MTIEVKDKKSERFLLLLQAICRRPNLRLSEKEAYELLGGASKATFYRNIQELTNDFGDRRAILVKHKDENNNVFYTLNKSDWYCYLEGQQKLQFIFGAYREMGHLLPKLENEGVEEELKDSDRKFMYRSSIKTKENNSENILDSIIRSLVGEKKMLIEYKRKTVDIYPLTLCQYRDELYLLAYKNEMKKENIRSYKITRFQKAIELAEGFRYPPPSKWNPKDHFRGASGIMIGEIKESFFRVYGDSRILIEEKNFMEAKLLKKYPDYDEYQCFYTNVEEFVGTLFIYGQDIEIMSDEILRQKFISKASAIISRNMPAKKIAS